MLLPIILFEMEVGRFALVGALDLACLCIVCAGVCSAVFLSSSPVEARACMRAVSRLATACGVLTVIN